MQATRYASPRRVVAYTQAAYGSGAETDAVLDLSRAPFAEAEALGEAIRTIRRATSRTSADEHWNRLKEAHVDWLTIRADPHPLPKLTFEEAVAWAHTPGFCGMKPGIRPAGRADRNGTSHPSA